MLYSTTVPDSMVQLHVSKVQASTVSMLTWAIFLTFFFFLHHFSKARELQLGVGAWHNFSFSSRGVCKEYRLVLETEISCDCVCERKQQPCQMHQGYCCPKRKWMWVWWAKEPVLKPVKSLTRTLTTDLVESTRPQVYWNSTQVMVTPSYSV